MGPKIALRILSSLSPEEIFQAVVSQDVELLKRTPGVGKKTAERLVMELKDHLEQADLVEAGDRKGDFIADAVEALTVLGYRRSDAYALARKTQRELPHAKRTLEEFLKEILKRV